MHAPKAEAPSEIDGMIAVFESPLQQPPFSTFDVAQRVTDELKTHLIPQLIFADVVLGGLDQGSVCKYLKYPMPWAEAGSRAKAVYEKMAEWLEKPEEERMAALKEAVQRRIEEREAAKGSIVQQRATPIRTVFGCGDLQLDTVQIAARVRDELRRHNIPQGVFARMVAGTSHSTCCTLLKHPNPTEWVDATGKPKNRSVEPFRRMADWLAQPEEERLPTILAAVEEEKQKKEQAKGQADDKYRSGNSIQPGALGALEDLLSDYSHHYSPPVTGNSNDQPTSSSTWLMASNYAQPFDPRPMQMLPTLSSISNQSTGSISTGPSGSSNAPSKAKRSKLDYELELLRGVGPEAYAAWWRTKGATENASELLTMLRIVGTEALKEMLFERAKQHGQSPNEITIED